MLTRLLPYSLRPPGLDFVFVLGQTDPDTAITGTEHGDHGLKYSERLLRCDLSYFC